MRAVLSPMARSLRRFSGFARISISGVLSAALLLSVSVEAAETGRPPSQAELEYYTAATLPALRTVERAVPPAPEGWTIAERTKIDPAPALTTEAMQALRFQYLIIYKRTSGVKEQQAKLQDRYSASSQHHQEAAKPWIDDLIRQQTDVSLRLRKAVRRRDAAAEKQLNEELDANGRRMRALHEEVEKRISADVEPYLVRDTEASIRIAVNEHRAELPGGTLVPVAGAAFAVQKGGERSGMLAWKEGRLLVLYGDWQQLDGTTFVPRDATTPQNRKVQRLAVTVTGDAARARRLLEHLDIQALRSLLQGAP